jgi:hypothetical protein
MLVQVNQHVTACLQAKFLCLRPDDVDQLRSKVTKDTLENPPLGYEPAAAAELACKEAVTEVAAGEAAAAHFDGVLNLDSAVGAHSWA